MASYAKVTGVDRTRETLRRYHSTTTAGFHKGLIAGGLFLESSATLLLTNTLYAQPEPPEKVRKRTGNLRASRMTTWTAKGAPSKPPVFAADPFATQSVSKGFAQASKEASEIANDKQNDSEFRVVVGYGAYYALYVHEGSANGFGYKWLEQALNNDRDLFIRLTRAGLKGGDAYK